MKRYCVFVTYVLMIGLLFGRLDAVCAQAPAGDVTVVTILDVVPDYSIPHNVDGARASLRTLAEQTQHAPGLVSFKVLQDAGRTNHFVILAVWKDRQSFDAYSGADATRAFRQAFQPRQGGPFDERVYTGLN